MTIRTRLALIYVVAIVVTVGLGGALVSWQLGSALRGALDQALAARATAVLISMENQGQAGLQEGDPASSPRIFVLIFDPQGRRVDTSAGVPADLASLGAGVADGTVSSGSSNYAIHVAVGDGGARVVTGSDLAAIDATLDRLARSLVLVGTVAAFVSLAGGWWLAGRALRPVELITKEAALIGAADLDRRLPVPRQRDELQALASTLNGMLDRVAEALRRQRIFVAAASHDLRTPIAALQAELELAEDDRTTTEELRSALQAAHADVVRLGELATALLDLASVDSDGRALVRSAVRTDLLVEAVARRVAPLARERDTRLLHVAPARVVRVDRMRLERALTNLVVNAITYGPPAAVVEIVARIETMDPPGDGEAGMFLLIEVLDRGPGVPDELAERLFQPFLRGPNTSEPGTGLGLATAAAAIRAHHGTLGVERREGGGSRFWLRVPA